MSPSAGGSWPGRVYDFHGVTLALHGDLPAVRLLEARLRPFPRRLDVGRPDLSFEFSSEDSAHPGPAVPIGSLRPIYNFEGAEIVYSDSLDEMYISYNDGVRVRCDVGRGHVSVSVLRPEATNQWLASHLFFTIAFVELLKRRSRYSLHAAGLCVNGRALLLPGASGSGKTTLAAALMQAGFAFLGDDMLFLTAGADGLKVLAFPDELDIAPDAGALLPALRHLIGAVPAHGGPKHRVRPEDLHSVPRVWACTPKALVFPRVAHADASVLTPIDADEALLELAPNILLTEPRACQAHLDVLGRLARETSCYRLDTGRDFRRLPEMMAGLIA